MNTEELVAGEDGVVRWVKIGTDGKEIVVVDPEIRPPEVALEIVEVNLE